MKTSGAILAILGSEKRRVYPNSKTGAWVGTVDTGDAKIQLWARAEDASKCVYYSFLAGVVAKELVGY